MAMFLIIVGLIILVLYFLNQNKTEKKDVTTITHKRVIQTEDGEVRIERRQTLNSVQTSYAKKDIIQNQIKDIEKKEITNTVNTDLKESVNNITTKNVATKARPESQLNLLLQSTQQELDLSDMETQVKDCPKCQKNLNYNSFGNSSKNPDGLTKWCLECLSNSTKKVPPKANQKYCPKCKKNRMKTSFNKNSKQEDGLTKWCKDCM